MHSILNALAVYVFLLVVFHLTGKRSLGQITTFDFVLLLIIGESIQQGLAGEDYSLTNAFLLVITLIGVDVLLSFLKQRSRAIERLTDGVPLVILENGRPLSDRMDKERVDESDILAAARLARGIDRLEDIRLAVLERDGHISIIPK